MFSRINNSRHVVALVSDLLVTGLLITASINTSVAALPSDAIEVVTVSATPINLTDVGSSISVISRSDILNRNAMNVLDLLREVPGFAVSQQGSTGAIAQVRVRGAEANQVLVLIDGIEANDISQSSEFDFSALTTADIERIEIVRGPQSALWGSDAMAGVINIITRPGSGDTATVFTAGVEAGSFGTARTNLGVTRIGTRAQTKATLNYLESDGSNISRTGSEKDGTDNLTVGLSGSYELADYVLVSYTARYTNKTTEFDNIDFFTTGLPVDADYKTDSEYLYTGFEVQHTVTANIDQSLRFSRTNSDNKTRAANPTKDITRGTKDAIQYQINLIEDQHRISLLAEHESDAYQQRGVASFFGDPNQNRKADTNSLAAEYRFDSGPLHLSLSARQDNNSDFDDGSAWRATGNWQFAQTTLFASVGESYKNPTFTERFGFFTNFIGNSDLAPEQSMQWEAGISQRLLDNRLNIALSYFDADLTNEINGFVYDFATGGFTSANVAGESTRQGVELALAFAPTERLRFNATYTYLDADQQDSFGKAVTEVRRPKHSGSISANYAWSDAGLHFAVSHTGTQEDDFFPPFPPFIERVELDAFTLVSLSGFYKLNSKVTLTGTLENLADDDYEQVFGFESPGFGGYLGIRVAW